MTRRKTRRLAATSEREHEVQYRAAHNVVLRGRFRVVHLSDRIGKLICCTLRAQAQAVCLEEQAQCKDLSFGEPSHFLFCLKVCTAWVDVWWQVCTCLPPKMSRCCTGGMPSFSSMRSCRPIASEGHWSSPPAGPPGLAPRFQEPCRPRAEQAPITVAADRENGWSAAAARFEAICGVHFQVSRLTRTPCARVCARVCVRCAC